MFTKIKLDENGIIQIEGNYLLLVGIHKPTKYHLDYDICRNYISRLQASNAMGEKLYLKEEYALSNINNRVADEQLKNLQIDFPNNLYLLSMGIGIAMRMGLSHMQLQHYDRAATIIEDCLISQLSLEDSVRDDQSIALTGVTLANCLLKSQSSQINHVLKICELTEKHSNRVIENRTNSINMQRCEKIKKRLQQIRGNYALARRVQELQTANQSYGSFHTSLFWPQPIADEEKSAPILISKSKKK